MPCVSLPVEHYMFNLELLPISINFISVLQTSWMIRTSPHRPFLMEVDPVETNQRMELFYPLLDPSMDDDVAIILSSSRETTKTSKIRLPPLPSPSFRSISLHPNERPSPAHPCESKMGAHMCYKA